MYHFFWDTRYLFCIRIFCVSCNKIQDHSVRFFVLGKGIINEQFVLNRLANATIDIYANSCVLSRCTKSLNDGVESAHHEEMLAKVWCSESYNRIMDNLNQLKNPEVLDNFKTMSKISEAVCEKVAPVQGNPLGF